MSYYLAIHEAPCVGVAPVAFEADTDAQAELFAFEQSVTDPQFVIGGYDLYRITYNHMTHKHELTPVVPDDAPIEDAESWKNEFMLMTHAQNSLYMDVKNPVTGHFHFE